MRHGKKINHLGRKSAHRKAMLANMACSLIEHKRINTTLAKAKALRGYVEPLITKSKDDSTHSRRTVFSYLKNKYAVSELFREVAPKVGERPGGYTRIIKIGNRLGDAAEMAMIELVDFNEVYTTDSKSDKGSKTRRSRRGGKKNTPATDKAAAPAAEAKKEVEAKEDAVVEDSVKEKAETEASTEKKVETPKAEESTDEKKKENKEEEEGGKKGE